MSHGKSDETEKAFAAYLVVDGLPIITEAKQDKLKKAVSKCFKTYKCNIKNIDIPFNGKDSLGVCFVECETAEEAEKLVKENPNGLKLDDSFTMVLNLWSELAAHDKLPENPPVPASGENKALTEDLYSWLNDPLGCDHYLTWIDEDVEVMANKTNGEKPATVIRRSKFTSKDYVWSPRGTFLASTFSQGVLASGGSKFESFQRFPHEDVVWCEFSPCERYLVTYSNRPPKGCSMMMWDVLSGLLLKTWTKQLEITRRDDREVAREDPENPFLWSYDSKYFVRLDHGQIEVYETPSCTQASFSPIKLGPNVAAVSWSPSDHYLACYVSEVENNPARVVLLRAPDRKELNQKILYGVTGCMMHWHPSGDFLAVEVTMSAKKRAQTSFELFLIREKSVPIDILQIEDTCIGFEWEPKGKRFGIVHTEDPSSTTRNNISFYSMDSKQVKHIITLEKRQANRIYWSPAGRIAVLAGIRNPNGIFEFYDVQDKDSLAADLHHPMTTDCAWDPTGRYFVTYVSYAKEKVENGYCMWTLAGQKILSEMRTKFKQFAWRPRPPTLLSKEVESDIEKNIKSIAENYKKEDELKRKQLHDDKKAEKTKLRTAFEAFANAQRQKWNANAAKRQDLRNGYKSDDEEDWIITTTVEDLIIEEKRELIA